MLLTLIQAILLASSGLLAIGSITIVILLLLSEDGLSKAISYATGYFSSYMLIGVTLVILEENVNLKTSKTYKTWFSVIILCFGIFLLIISLRGLRKKSKTMNDNSRMFQLIKTISPRKAFALGITVTILNFKNLILYVTAISVIVVSDQVFMSKVISTIIVASVFCFSVFFPSFVYVLFPKQREKVLLRIKWYLNRNKHKIGIIAPLVFGVLLILKGVVGLL